MIMSHVNRTRLLLLIGVLLPLAVTAIAVETSAASSHRGQRVARHEIPRRALSRKRSTRLSACVSDSALFTKRCIERILAASSDRRAVRKASEADMNDSPVGTQFDETNVNPGSAIEFVSRRSDGVWMASTRLPG
jgi:hypothetical protein